MNKVIARAAVALLIVLGATATADAVSAAPRPKPKVELFGQGDFQTDAWGLTAVHADMDGRPFDGSFSGGLLVDQRRFPEPGECLDADILFVVWQGHRSLDFITMGEICGTEPGAPVAYVYTGTFDLYQATSNRNLLGTDGWIEVRLLNDGGAAVTIVDS